jgi:uncharacterized protein
LLLWNIINFELGASTDDARYSNKAIKSLLKKNFLVEAIGNKDGVVEDVIIQKGQPKFDDIDTVTLYINPLRQKEYYNYILGLKPKRIIFNPGTENPEFESLLRNAGINTEQACTLVLLNIGGY